MTQQKRPGSLSQYQRESAIRRKQAPAGPNPNQRLYTGLILLAALIASIVALWKPFAQRTEYLYVTAPSVTDTEVVRKALTATGALPNPNSVAIAPDGKGSFTVASADTKNPLTSDTWKALASALPSKLSGANVSYKAEAPAPINLGLDLQGGLRVVMGASVANPTFDQMERVRNIIENRVSGVGVVEPLVQVQGNRQVVLEYPGLTQAQQATILKLIGQAAKLEFRIVKDEAASKSDDTMTVDDLLPAGATGEDITDAQAGFDQFGRPQVSMKFSAAGAAKMGELTGNNIQKRMAIVLDQKVITAPTIQGRISDQGEITSISTPEEASQIALVLRSGSLPFNIAPEEIKAIGPVLGKDAIRSGLVASVIGIAAVFLLVYGYYGLYFGTVAALGLVFSGLLIFGILGGLGAALTLPGIAGLVLTIGAAVDGNVISFERVKEELRDGKGIKAAVRAGFGHSLATILDVNLSHLLSAFALYSYSTGPVRGFAVVLAIGVIASTFSNLVFSHWLLEQMSLRFNFSAPQWFATPKFDFMRLSKFVTTISLSLAVIGAILIFTKGFNFGVDFISGTSIEIKTGANVSTEQVRNAVAAANIPDVTAAGASIVETQTVGSGGKDFTVRVPEIRNQANLDKLRAALNTLPAAPGVSDRVVQTNTVGPAVGNELRSKTITAALLALGLILIYVAFRFDVMMGIGSVLAVAHDVAIVMGLFALLGREFSITTVAAILTLIGYSLNDSIIVSDRMRENFKLMRGKHPNEVVNTSINQTLSRTIMTSVSTMLPLVALLFLGGPVLRDFSLVLLIGIIVGTYSSIYIVAPMVVIYRDWLAARRTAARRANA